MAIEVTKTWSTNGYNGLLDWLGKNKGIDVWAHPETNRALVSTDQSSDQGAAYVSHNAIDQATDTSTGRSHTQNLPLSWWVIDFGSSVSVAATRIGIRGQSSSGNHPKWTHIQGSADGAVWNELHDLAGTAVTNGAWSSWAITDTTPYRYFRIRHTRNLADSSGANYLVIGDVEIWGDYHDTAAASPASTFVKQAGWSGLFEWLGQNKSSSAWAHPETSRALCVTSMSTTQGGYSSGGALSHLAGASHTQNVATSWWKVDLGSGHDMILSSVAMYGRISNNPRNFRIEGSNDDSAWDELYDVPDGSTGPTNGAWTILDMDTAVSAYRYFRVVMYGTNDTGNNYLALEAIEFFGQFDYVAPAASPGGWDQVAFTVEIETATDDVFSDVTDDYVSAQFHTASRQGWGQNFNPGHAVITLKNNDVDLEYSVGSGDDLIDVSRKVKISITHDETTTVLWRGFVSKVTIVNTPHQVKLSSIVCRTALAVAGRTNRPALAPVGADDTMAERLGRILDSVGWPTALRDLDTGAYPLSLDTTLAGSALAELQLVAQSINGEVYEDVASGEIVSLNPATRAAKWAEDAVLTLVGDTTGSLPDTESAYYSDETIAGADLDEVVNFVDVSAPGTTPGQDRWVYQNLDSQAKHGRISYIRTDLLPTGGNYAQNHAYFMVAKFPTADQRIGQVTIDSGGAEFVDALIGLALLDAVTMSQVFGPNHLSGRTQVQGIHHDIRPGRPSTATDGRSDLWTVILDLDDTEVGAYVAPDGWILGDTDGSLLGVTTVIYNAG